MHVFEVNTDFLAVYLCPNLIKLYDNFVYLRIGYELEGFLKAIQVLFENRTRDVGQYCRGL